MIRDPLFSTYRQGENRVTSSMLATKTVFGVCPEHPVVQPRRTGWPDQPAR